MPCHQQLTAEAVAFARKMADRSNVTLRKRQRQTTTIFAFDDAGKQCIFLSNDGCTKPVVPPLYWKSGDAAASEISVGRDEG